MEFTKKVRNLKRKLPALKHRLAEQGRRLCAVVICASLVIGGFPGAFFQAFAADESGEYVFEFDKASLQYALNAAVGNGTTLDSDLLFLGDNAGEYAELFNPDGTLYELRDLEPNEDAERDKDIGLRAFVRLEGDINIDESYEIDGSEEVLFLFTNKTDISNYVQIVLEDAETEWIEVPAAKDIPVEMPDDLAVTLSPVGGAGSAGMGGDIVIEGISSDEEEDTDIYEDSEVSIEEADEDAEAAENEADSENADDEGREKSSATDDAGESDSSHDEADSSDDGDSSDKADSGKDEAGDSSSDKDSSSDNDSSSDKDSSNDNSSSGDKDSSSDKDSSYSKDSSADKDSSNTDRPSRHRGATNGRESSHDKDSDGEKSASISVNKTQLLAASLTLASSSNADEADDASPSDASPSDASRVIDGTVYDPVRLGRWGAVAFGTTTADLGLDESDEIFSVAYEGDDYTITVEYDSKAALPEDVILTGEEYDKDSDTFFERYEEARELYGWEEGKEPAARLFDVTLWSGDEEIEPAAAVDVTFTFFTDDEDEYGIAFLSADAEDGEDEYADDAEEDAETGYNGLKYTITHFGAEETETVDSEVISEAGEQSVTFTLESFSDIMVFAWEGNTSGKVVLNLGNGNGKYNFADYTGDNSEGTNLRYTTDDLSKYVLDEDNDTGHLFIYLPCDNDLDTNFSILRDTDGSAKETIQIGKDLAYDYELVGWVNIATGEYYDVSNGATPADIYLTNENVFYADWAPRSYNNGKSSEGTLREDTVSTGEFVTIKMFDYNDLFNMYSASVEQNGITSETWSDSKVLHSNLLGLGDEDFEITESFVFNNDGTTAGKKAGGMLQFLNDRTAGNTWTGTPKKDDEKIYVIDAQSTWGVYDPGDPYDDKAGDTILGLLFNKEIANETVGVNYVGDADGLFWIDDKGYYTYDSAESAACYEKSDGKFYVYDKPQYVYGKSRPCFLPYNSYSLAPQFIDEEHSNEDDYKYSVYDGSIDYWFGMSMEVDFYLPSTPGVKGTDGEYGNQVNGQNMVFNFSGDDDIMIFVDDDLVLDMSGIHDLSYGSINFSTGDVIIGMSRSSDGTIDTSYGGITGNISTTVKSGNHSLKVYYMERGGWESNLEIQFNVVPLWDYEVGDVQTVIAEKTWVDSKGNEIDPAELKDVYKTGIEVGLFDVLSESENGLGYKKDGTKYTFDYIDDSGIEHIFIYDSSGPTLTYTEVEDDSSSVQVEFKDVDSYGRVLDTYGNVVCWLDEDTQLLHMRMDVQELNGSNDWYYAWELLDADGEYEVLELTENPSYSTSRQSKELSTYQYWSIIGEEEIQKYLQGSSDSDEPLELLQIILTEAAQEASDTLGDTKEAYGYVIVANSNGNVGVEQVKFSQIATLVETEEEATGSVGYFGTYGVTSQSEIARLGDGAIWYVVDANHEDQDVGGGTVEGFYLYCELNGTDYYLALNSGKNGLYATTDTKSEFFYDALGELMIEVSEGETVRVEILDDGAINIGEGEEEAALDDVRLYTLTDTPTSGFTFTAVNKFLPDFTLKKINSETEEALSDVSFSLMNKGELYYDGLDADTDEIKWSETVVSINTDEYGEIIFHYLPDGDYILTEEKAADGYNYLPSSIKISILEGKIIACEWTDSSVQDDINDYISRTEDGLTITIGNFVGSIFPLTGGPGTMPFRIAGLLISSSAVWLYIILRRRRRWIES